MATGKGMPVTTTWMGMVQAWAEGGRGWEAEKPEDWGGVLREVSVGETTCARCQWPREVGHRVRHGTGSSVTQGTGGS